MLRLIAGMLAIRSSPPFAAWWRELDVDCGCFGGTGGGQRDLLVGVARNVALIAAAVWLGWRQHMGRID